MQGESDREHHGHGPAHHVASLTMYFGVFIALLVLTALTVAAYKEIDIGALNTPLALLIATIKAALVILFFMHVIQSSRLTWVVVASSFLWLAVLFVLTFADYLTRNWAM